MGLSSLKVPIEPTSAVCPLGKQCGGEKLSFMGMPTKDQSGPRFDGIFDA